MKYSEGLVLPKEPGSYMVKHRTSQDERQLAAREDIEQQLESAFDFF